MSEITGKRQSWPVAVMWLLVGGSILNAIFGWVHEVSFGTACAVLGAGYILGCETFTENERSKAG